MHPLPQVAFAAITVSPWRAMLGCAQLIFLFRIFGGMCRHCFSRPSWLLFYFLIFLFCNVPFAIQHAGYIWQGNCCPARRKKKM